MIRVFETIFQLIIQKTKEEREVTQGKVELDQNIFIHRALDLVQKGHFNWQDVEDECNVIVFGVI